MLDIRFVRENPDVVKENIRKKFQDEKIPLVDECIEIDAKVRALKGEGDNLRSERNSTSTEIGSLMREKKVEEANAKKERVKQINARLDVIEKEEAELAEVLKQKMMVIPNIIDDSVPIGRDDSENVEIQKYGEPVVPDFEIPYHADACEALSGLDKESAGRTSGKRLLLPYGRYCKTSLCNA